MAHKHGPHKGRSTVKPAVGVKEWTWAIAREIHSTKTFWETLCILYLRTYLLLPCKYARCHSSLVFARAITFILIPH
jgi:hypothetical protein